MPSNRRVWLTRAIVATTVTTCIVVGSVWAAGGFKKKEKNTATSASSESTIGGDDILLPTLSPEVALISTTPSPTETNAASTASPMTQTTSVTIPPITSSPTTGTNGISDPTDTPTSRLTARTPEPTSRTTASTPVPTKRTTDMPTTDMPTAVATTSAPTASPTSKPTQEPTPRPTQEPTPKPPTAQPTVSTPLPPRWDGQSGALVTSNCLFQNDYAYAMDIYWSCGSEQFDNPLRLHTFKRHSYSHGRIFADQKITYRNNQLWFDEYNRRRCIVVDDNELGLLQANSDGEGCTDFQFTDDGDRLQEISTGDCVVTSACDEDRSTGGRECGGEDHRFLPLSMGDCRNGLRFRFESEADDCQNGSEEYPENECF